MKVDAPGLVAAAQRLMSAVEALGASGGVPHPPLAADPASVGAAERLTTAGAQLTTSLGAHVSALVASLEHLTGTAITFTETDQRNAAALATLNGGNAGAAAVAGSAPPPPPVPPDVRPPLPPAAGMMPEALSAAAHTGELSGGEAFTGAWSTASGAARDASQHLRSAVTQLPEVLDGPASTPAASRHLLAFADGLDTYADRGHALAAQANAYAGNLSQARQDIPTPEQHTQCPAADPIAGPGQCRLWRPLRRTAGQCSQRKEPTQPAHDHRLQRVSREHRHGHRRGRRGQQ